MSWLKKFLCFTAVLAGTLGLISASAFVFLKAFQYLDDRRVDAAAVSASSEASGLFSPVSVPPSGTSAPSRTPDGEQTASSDLSSDGEETSSEGSISAGEETSSEWVPSAGEESSEPVSVMGTSGTSDAEKELVLVNYSNKLPADYKLNLVKADGIEMDALTAQAYGRMRDAAKKDGVSLWVSSGYRSVEKQGELFSREVETYEKTAGTKEEAETFAEKSVARPGYSEHSTGLAIDLNGVLDSFDNTDAFRWLDAHAPEYGFILRYPKDKQEITKIKYEPWHYRYVGRENAEIMKQKNLCLEEYLKTLGKTGSAN